MQKQEVSKLIHVCKHNHEIIQVMRPSVTAVGAIVGRQRCVFDVQPEPSLLI